MATITPVLHERLRAAAEAHPELFALLSEAAEALDIQRRPLTWEQALRLLKDGKRICALHMEPGAYWCLFHRNTADPVSVRAVTLSFALEKGNPIKGPWFEFTGPELFPRDVVPFK